MESSDIYRSIMKFAPNVVVCLSPERRITEFNAEAERLYGVKREDVIGKDYFILFLPPEVWEAVEEDMRKVLAGTPTRGFENPVIRKDGRVCILSWTVNCVTDSNGRPSGVMAIGQDITFFKQIEEQNARIMKLESELKTLTVTDALTGFFNGHGFHALAEKEFKIANRNRRKLSLLLVSLGNMRSIADVYGPAACDEAMIETAGILDRSFRESDIIGRTGEAEFAVVITDASEADIENTVRQHIKKNLAAINSQSRHEYKLQLCMGMSHYDPSSPCSLNELTAQADICLRRDKERVQLAKKILVSSDREKREHRRFPVNTVFVSGFNGTGKLRVRDISRGGICIRTSEQVGLNSIHDIAVFSHDGLKIAPTGIVVWSSPKKSAEASPEYETGVRFVNMSGPAQEALDQFIGTLSGH